MPLPPPKNKYHPGLTLWSPWRFCRTSVLRKDRFDEREADFYEALYTQSQAQFDAYVSAGTVVNNYAHIFDLLIRLRQAGSPRTGRQTGAGRGSSDRETDWRRAGAPRTDRPILHLSAMHHQCHQPCKTAVPNGDLPGAAPCFLLKHPSLLRSLPVLWLAPCQEPRRLPDHH
jgi:hypothetical protein